MLEFKAARPAEMLLQALRNVNKMQIKSNLVDSYIIPILTHQYIHETSKTAFIYLPTL